MLIYIFIYRMFVCLINCMRIVTCLLPMGTLLQLAYYYRKLCWCAIISQSDSVTRCVGLPQQLKWLPRLRPQSHTFSDVFAALASYGVVIRPPHVNHYPVNDAVLLTGRIMGDHSNHFRRCRDAADIKGSCQSERSGAMLVLQRALQFTQCR